MVKIILYTPQELNHSSYVQTGLFELENEGFVTTNVKLSLKKRLGTIKIEGDETIITNQPHPKTSFYKLEDKNNTIDFAIDLYDASNSFSLYALKNCDYIFKRNYEKKYVEKLPKEYQDKIYPLGLTFGVHSNHKKSWYKFYIGLIFSNLLVEAKFDRFFFKRIKKSIEKQLAHWKFINTSRNINSFDSFNNPNENIILFQTRCFLREDNKDLKEIHEDRYEIIKLLRKEFPQNFKGGFITSKIVNEKYSDAITNLKVDPESYLKLVKEAKIGIYTRGIQRSPAWKMAEYLSQGKIIIAEKLETELPITLENEKHLLFFEKLNDISLLCRKVLEDETLAEELRLNARKFYEENIKPTQNIKRIINFMLMQNK